MNTYEKMREALEQSANLLDRILVRTELDDEIHRIALEAQNMADGVLSLSPRNCDVGTAEEQMERFKEYCQSNMQYYQDMFGTHEGAGGWDCREDCPIGKMVDKNDSFCDHCELLWAQMPYEEGGAK